ncbi:MAG: ribonuclease E inhibitor RraB [Verrucomicrobiaceae bacterium]|nr:MAG: ribonuclease E inhibitor RraB [Verrucomicrobiaceae bacterium]
MNIPQDADGDAMRRVLSHGSNVYRPMNIDFMVACSNVPTAEEVMSIARSRGYSTKISVDPEDETVTCYCTKRMLLDYEALVSAQSELDVIAEAFGGYCDGWGTFGNVSPSQQD